ncbi:hypothetical protein JCM10908_003505 [Rhodotorula pacifica]|uniref:uncharacterized protein n=1 Tax=Rhodotorula pacifica TaxID=1495444 RepID=UPI00316DACE4
MLATHLTTHAFPHDHRSRLPRHDPAHTRQLGITNLRPRPDSVLSAHSINSNASSASASSAIYPDDRHRRSSALLDLDLNLELDDATHLSLRRAEKILRASERAREEDKRRSTTSSLRWRDSTFVGEHSAVSNRSTALAHSEDETERLDVQESPLSRTAPKPAGRRFSPKRFLLALPSASGDTPVPRQISSPKPLAPSPPRSVGGPPALSSSNAALPPQARGRIAPQKHNLLDTARAPLPLMRPPRQQPFRGETSASAAPVVPFAAQEEIDSSRRSTTQATRQSGDEHPPIVQRTTQGFKSFRKKLGRRSSRKASEGTTSIQKASLASLFRFGNAADESSASDTRQPRDISGRTQTAGVSPSSEQTLSSSGTSGHRPSTSVSSYAPSTTTSGSAAASRGSSRLGFFRSIGKRNSDASQRTRPSRQISTANISAPIPLSPNRGQAVATAAESSGSSARPPSPRPVKEDTTWKARIGRAIQGKNVAAKRALFETRGVKLAAPPHADETADTEDLTARPTTHPKGYTAASAVQPSFHAVAHQDAAEDVALVRSRAAAFDALAIQSSAPRMRARMRAAPKETLLDDRVAFRPAENASSHTPASATVATDQFKDPQLSSHRLVAEPRSQQTYQSRSSVSSDLMGSAHSRERLEDCRSISSARFRNYSHSLPAGSPEKDARGLPIPLDASPRSARQFNSPKRSALGPEHAFRKQLHCPPTGPITRVRGATTDLAELLGGLEDTAIYEASPRKGTMRESASPAHPDKPSFSSSSQYRLPCASEQEMLYDSAADVPGDLRTLITEVDERLSVQLDDMVGRGFADEFTSTSLTSSFSSSSSSSSSSSDDSDDSYAAEPLPERRMLSPHEPGPQFLAPPFEYTSRFTSDEGETTRAFEPTWSSFEGHYSTAAAALRSMLSTGAGVVQQSPPASATLRAFAPPPSATLRPVHLHGGAAQATCSPPPGYMGRPSAGEKMFDLVDGTVPLSPLITESSAASSFASGIPTSLVSARRSESPSPLPFGPRRLRESLSRYSQEGQIRDPPRQDAHSSSEQSIGSWDQKASSSDPTNHSLALSLQSTNLSITSLQSSPCPAPRRRRIPMLTARTELRLGFRFPLERIRDEDSLGLQPPSTLQAEQAVDGKDIVDICSEAASDNMSPQSVPYGPFNQSAVVADPQSWSSARIVELDLENQDELDRIYCAFVYEADMELKRFVVPRTYFNILDFLFASQTRFPTPPHLHLSSFVAAAFDDPPTPSVSIAADSIAPSPAAEGHQKLELPVEYGRDDEQVGLAAFEDAGQTLKPAARPLRKPLLVKSVNAHPSAPTMRALASVSAETKALSPFTALPPRLKMRLREASTCSTHFFGNKKLSRRRQGQVDAAMRKLEGIGAPDEQHSGGETDDTGALEAQGEATEDLSFSGSPLTASVRPRVRPRAVLSMMR